MLVAVVLQLMEMLLLLVLEKLMLAVAVAAEGRVVLEERLRVPLQAVDKHQVVEILLHRRSARAWEMLGSRGKRPELGGGNTENRKWSNPP